MTEEKEVFLGAGKKWGIFFGEKGEIDFKVWEAWVKIFDISLWLKFIK